MIPVQVIFTQGCVVLRARSSELLILQDHVINLAQLKDPREFSEYFMNEALVNRPARKLFVAWLRKDKGVWTRLYKIIQENVKAEDIEKAKADAAQEEQVLEKSAAPAKAVKAKKEEKEVAVEKAPEKKSAAKKVAKKASTKVAKEPAKKVSKVKKEITAAPAKKVAKKKASTSVAKKAKSKA